MRCNVCAGPDVPKGLLYSINPVVIIFLTPVVAALTRTRTHYSMIKVGGYVTAASPFFLVFSSSIWAAVCFVLLLSFGEAIWSPRVFDYTMSVAPEGKEAMFTALATAPLFAAKVPVGLLSGVLMKTFIPEHGKQRPQTLWLIIGMLTLSSPLLITAFESCVREPEAVLRKGSEVDLVEATTNPLADEAAAKRKAGVTRSPPSVVDYDA